MRCPKCERDSDHRWPDPPGDLPNNRAYKCLACGTIYTEHQQAEIERLKEELAELKSRCGVYEECSECHHERVTQVERLTEENESLRNMLWLLWPDPQGMKYGDDGEMQLSAIDFKRDSIGRLENEFDRLRKENIKSIPVIQELRKENAELKRRLKEAEERTQSYCNWFVRLMDKIGSQQGG